MADSLELYTVVFLQYDGRFLLLERARDKAYAPGMWTGVGGRIEGSEMADVAASALREVEEETGITPGEIERFTLRRVVLFQLTGFLPMKRT